MYIFYWYIEGIRHSYEWSQFVIEWRLMHILSSTILTSICGNRNDKGRHYSIFYGIKTHLHLLTFFSCSFFCTYISPPTRRQTFILGSVNTDQQWRNAEPKWCSIIDINLFSPGPARTDGGHKYCIHINSICPVFPPSSVRIRFSFDIILLPPSTTYHSDWLACTRFDCFQLLSFPPETS